MIYGLTFNGRHCHDLGVFLTSAPRPIMAENKDEFEQLPGVSGSFLIEDKSKNDIFITATFWMHRKTRVELFQSAREIGAWLDSDGWKPLIFDDDPGVYYEAKATTNVTLDQLENFEEIADFTVNFRCHPIVKDVV